MNAVYIIDQMKLGFDYSKRMDRLYKRLKCFSKDVHQKFDLSAGDDFNSHCPVFACRFCPIPKYTHYLAVVNEDGKVAIKDSRRITREPSTLTLQAHNNAIFDVMWTNADMKFLTASGDHSCVLWDFVDGDLKLVHKFTGHERSVKTISNKPDDNFVFATGGRDGFIILWDIRSNQEGCKLKPDKCIKYPHVKMCFEKKMTPNKKRPNIKIVEDSGRDSITGIIFQDGNTLISCSASDGFIKIWDMRKTYSTKLRSPQPLHTMNYPGNSGRNGFTNLAISPCRTKLYANCMDSTVYCYNIGTYNLEPVQAFKGHTVSSFYVKNSVSPDGNYIASGSSDNHAYIWSVHEPHKPIVKLQGHEAEVTCVDWCKSGEVKIATCADDASYHFWRIYNCEGSKEDFSFNGQAVIPPDPENEQNVISLEYAHKRKFSTITHFKEDNKVSRLTEASYCRENDDPNSRPPQSFYSSISPEIKMKTKQTRLQETPVKDVLSPTSNLPNFVIDGTSPHSHRCRQSHLSSEDWLTKMRRSKVQDRASTVSPKRRSSQSGMKSAKESLFKYFTKSIAQSSQNENPKTLSEQTTIIKTDSNEKDESLQ